MNAVGGRKAINGGSGLVTGFEATDIVHLFDTVFILTHVVDGYAEL